MADGVTTAGAAEVTAEPDRATVTLGVSVRRPAAPAAVSAAAAAADRLLAAVDAAGVDADVRTVAFAVDQEYVYPPEGGARPDGVRVTHTVAAVTAAPDLAAAVGALLDAAYADGGDDVVVQGVTFEVADDASLRARARELAFADARASAEQYAALAGRRLGAVISVDDTGGPAAGPPMLRSAKAFDASTPIRPGRVAVGASVTVVWALVD